MAANFGSYNFQRNYGYSFAICTLRVDARVPGWQRDVTQVLSGIPGVNNLKMIPNGIIEVSGTVHPNLILDGIWRTGRNAEIVSVQSGNGTSYSYRPGHGGQEHQYYPGHSRYQHCAGDGFGRGVAEYAACNGRSSSLSSYGGYWNHLPSPSYNRPFAGLVESFMRPPSASPRWFWHQ